MNAREFFYLTADLRRAQKDYFQTRDRKIFAKCRALENQLDREIARVRSLTETE